LLARCSPVTGRPSFAIVMMAWPKISGDDQRNDDDGDGIAELADALPGPEQAEIPLPQQPEPSAGHRFGLTPVKKNTRVARAGPYSPGP
jgi:hypothetical protein